MLTDTQFSTLADNDEIVFYEQAKDRLSRIQFELLKLGNAVPEDQNVLDSSFKKETALYEEQDRLLDDLKQKPISSIEDSIQLLEIWSRIKIAEQGREELGKEDELIFHVIDSLKALA